MTLVAIEQGQKNLQDGDINEERATRFFVVYSDVVAEPVMVSNASGIPDYFDAHPSDDTYLLKQKRTRSLGEEAGRFTWEVQCDYSNKVIRPLDMPAQIEWDFSEASESYFIDTEGNAVINSAGQPFDTIPTRETGSIIATITKNVADDFDVSLFLSFRQKLNSAPFEVDGVSLDAHQAKVSGASVSPVQVSAGDSYRVVKLALKFKQTWDDHFADMGYYWLDASELDNANKLKPILTGVPLQPVEKPWPLDGAGLPQDLPTDAPEDLVFKPYFESDFSDLSALLS